MKVLTLDSFDFVGETNDEAIEMEDLPIVKNSSSGISSARQLIDTTNTTKLVSDSADYS